LCSAGAAAAGRVGWLPEVPSQGWLRSSPVT